MMPESVKYQVAITESLKETHIFTYVPQNPRKDQTSRSMPMEIIVIPFSGVGGQRTEDRGLRAES